tara:strand:- start:178 stop:690 length:513 start_codon:yes stop_codon:yes gene_type:complete
MWSFKKNMLKFIPDTLSVITCGNIIDFEGDSGVYRADIILGTETGIVNFDYNADGIPDRFQLYYDNILVADSLYVGSDLIGNPPDIVSGMVGNTYINIPEFDWVGGVFTPNGNVQTITVLQTDVAPFGETAGAGTLSFEKETSEPQTMQLVVTAPLTGTGWNVATSCPTT